ncbi:MAG: hypothetical protein IJ416_05075 [Ruminiclostridium sp.]|nr:hypothetical protein [Ruminiclostridium sp.]
MPQIPQISDSSSKSYSSTLTNNRGPASGGEQFTVDGANKPTQIQAANDKNTSNNPQTTMGQKDLIPLAVSVSKNQTLAVETIKDIINADLLSTAKLNGYTELAGELESLSSSLYIAANKLLDEILEQENHNTMFHDDKFYDLLRELAGTANDDLKEAIGNMLKAINFSQNKNEITSALSSNLKFLAEYFSPNRGLSQNLSALAERWASGEAETNFAALRNQTSDLLKNVSESLLNDQHTQTLLPIVIHNISKYNTNNTMLREYFGQLLTQVPSYEMRNELANAFEGLLMKLSGRTAEPESAQETTPFANYTIISQENQVENSFFSKETQTFQIFSSYLTENLSDEGYLSDIGMINNDFSEYITDLHSGSEDGLSVLKSLMTGLIADDDISLMLSTRFNQITSMNELVDFLNGFLETMPEGELRNGIFEVMDEAVQVLAETDPFMEAEATEKQAGANSSIRALTDFVAKNINHPALKSIDSFNASNLLQSMINAPGVFTPLAHYILPIQVEDTRAFGELWVDNDDDSGVTGAGGQKHYHLFLTFDVDTFGRFEVDVYANENTASVSLLHPVSFGKNIENLIGKINRIAAGAGYSISNFETGILKAPHNLSQVFPKLNERRAGLNVQA